MSAFVIKLSQQNVHMLACARRLISERGAIVEHNQKKGEGFLVEMHRDPRLSVNVLARRMQNKKKIASVEVRPVLSLVFRQLFIVKSPTHI